MKKARVYIRMSSLPQADGDSLRRQTERAEAYAEANGLDLVERDYWKDIGLSAFTGANLDAGKLGEFLHRIRDGKIERGSFLLVEAFDRLSREEPLKAALIVGEIVRSGVIVVTLNDQKAYDDLTKIDQLLPMMLSQTVSYQESGKKSDRGNATWEGKRHMAAVRPMTANCPAWLRLKGDQFEIVEERRRVVERIFNESISGLGVHLITKRLNRDRVPTFSGRGAGWGNTSVRNILTSRAVYGEFQPHSGKGRARKPEGEPIENYFPAILDEATFYRAAEAMKIRAVQKGGAKGPEYANLFKGLLFCARCGGRILVAGKNKAPDRRPIMQCERNRRGISCTEETWKYNLFEKAFLLHANLPLLMELKKKHAESKSHAINSQIAALTDRLVVLRNRSQNIEDTFAGAPMTPERQDSWRSIEREALQISQTLHDLQISQQHQNAADQIRVEDVDEFLLGSKEDADVLLARAQLSQNIARLIERIEVGLDGVEVFCSGPKAERLAMDEREHSLLLGERGPVLSTEFSDAKSFAVIYRDGGGHVVQPNPLRPELVRFYSILKNEKDEPILEFQKEYVLKQRRLYQRLHGYGSTRVGNAAIWK